MRTFIFLKKYKKGDKYEVVIKGMTQREHFPSDLINCSGSIFYGCDCKEVTEKCHVVVATVNSIF